MALTDRERQTLEVAGKRWAYRGALDQHIRDEFDETPTAFWARVNRLLDDPEALREYPQLVRRLQRVRDRRRAVRGAA